MGISKEMLRRLGECLIEIIVEEAKKDFAKRGWSGMDPMGGPPIWESFSWEIKGKSTLEIHSSFYGMDVLAKGAIPKRDMVWLRSRGKGPVKKAPPSTGRPKEYPYIKGRQSRRPQKQQKKVKIIPVRTNRGTVIFKTAPFMTQKAWIHPGIAKFTFLERALRKGKKQCAEILAEEALQQIFGG